MSTLKLDKFDQIGIVVKNIESVASILGNLLSFKSKINIVEQTSEVVYKGKKVSYKMKKIMQTFGGKQFEIVELVESTGDHLYLEFLREGNVGLHHLGVYTKNADELIDHFKKEYNIEVIQSGAVGKLRFDYLNTKKELGFYLELISF
ncbi:MAG: VOC family protein [Candidatus Hodarchaeota archaeon]